jgi:hypothetical protein
MRRWFWLATGFGLGVAASKRMRQRGGSERSGGITRVVASRVRAHVNAAVDEGRQEALRRERALRDVLASTREGTREDGQ